MCSFRRPGGSGTEPVSSDVAGMAGLEPTISESKSGVLPLHYIPRSQISLLKQAGTAGL